MSHNLSNFILAPAEVLRCKDNGPNAYQFPTQWKLGPSLSQPCKKLKGGWNYIDYH